MKLNIEKIINDTTNEHLEKIWRESMENDKKYKADRIELDKEEYREPSREMSENEINIDLDNVERARDINSI